MVFMPLSGFLFHDFKDGGWLFSKAAGIFISGWLFYVLNAVHLLEFIRKNCIFVLAFLLALNLFLLWFFYIRRKKPFFTDIDTRLIIIEEAIFLFLYFLWIWMIGFKPEAYGTEKFMDYSFMTSMMRNLWLPVKDPWYAGESINYYYGGQYLAVFLIKLTGGTVGEGYNLMRATETAFSFVLPFSLVYQMMYDRCASRIKNRGFGAQTAESGSGQKNASDGSVVKKTGYEQENTKKGGFLSNAGRFATAAGSRKMKIAPWAAGLVSGFATAFCGNFHYVIYGIILPIVNGISGASYTYWFPNSTRYIGYDPVIEGDQTIHEFPSYSSVLGDLHAHFLNIMFVVTVTAIAYSYAKRRFAELKQEKDRNAVSGSKAAVSLNGAKAGAARGEESEAVSPAVLLKEALLQPEILAIGLFTGVFRWTNYWDFPIYFVVCGSVIFFVNLRLYRGDIKRFLLLMAVQAMEAFAIGYAAALPFILSFEQISSEIHFTHSHSLLYQLLILWGLPVCTVIGYVVMLFKERRAAQTEFPAAAAKTAEAGAGPAAAADTAETGEAAHRAAEPPAPQRPGFPAPDLTVLLFGLCAVGLVILPEVIYVKDIYTGYYRANTMFKLTYQAFILFGISMGYILVRALVFGKKTARRTAAVGLILLALTGGYIFTSCGSWFGNVFDASKRISTDASVFVDEDFASDFGAISWLNNTVKGQPVVLEAPGDSYSEYERVSVATGLPTVTGWYVHEWLWRNNKDALDARVKDIKTIYTSDDQETVRALIEKYNISYIYVGRLEREKYPELNDTAIQALGTVAYSDGVSTYIIKVG